MRIKTFLLLRNVRMKALLWYVWLVSIPTAIQPDMVANFNGPIDRTQATRLGRFPSVESQEDLSEWRSV